MSFLTGKAGKSESESGNYAYPWIKSTYGPAGGNAFNFGTSTIQSILGGGPGGDAALDNWWNSSGGKFLLDQGLDTVTNKYASLGLSKSGAAMKGIEDYRSGLASTKLGEAMQQYFGLANLGLGAGNLISGAGQYSKSKSTGATQGLAGLIGSLASAAAAASDIRLKDNIELVATLPDGLKVFDFDYRRDLDPSLPEGRQRGVMAHDVARLRPWALGPVRPDGHATVNYALLGATA